MDPDIDVCQTEQPQISYSVDFTAEQSSAMGSPILLHREGKSLPIPLFLHKAVGARHFGSEAAAAPTRV